MKIMKIKEILVPIDFSNSSINGLRMAAVIAQHHKANVHLLHVNDSDYDLFEMHPGKPDPDLSSGILKRLRTAAKSIVDEYNIKCSYATEYGSVTHTILKTAAAIGADMIVVGKNRSNGAVKEYAGTQACQVAEKSVVPVMIVPNKINSYRFTRVLFPVRPLLSVNDKYDMVRELIMKSKSAITVLNLRDPDDENELHIIHRLNNIIKTRMEEDGLEYTAEYHYKDKLFAEKILSSIKNNENKYDLVIISSEAGSPPEYFRLEYYTQKIIHACNIPLLVIHTNKPTLPSKQVLQQLGSFESN